MYDGIMKRSCSHTFALRNNMLCITSYLVYRFSLCILHRLFLKKKRLKISKEVYRKVYILYMCTMVYALPCHDSGVWWWWWGVMCRKVKNEA